MGAFSNEFYRRIPAYVAEAVPESSLSCLAFVDLVERVLDIDPKTPEKNRFRTSSKQRGRGIL